LSAALLAAGLITPTASAWSQTPTLPTVTVYSEPSDYTPAESSSSTKTATPLLLTPQNVQVVPRAALDDQSALTLTEAVRNVAGVQYDFGFNGIMQPLLILRGFSATSMTALGSMSGSSAYHLDGTKVMGVPINMADVESVEVLKGPSSVMFGRSEPGGVVNVVAKKPSATPSLSFTQVLGSYGLTQSLLEGTGPLNADRTLLGRFSLSHYRSDSIRDFVTDRLGSFSGALSWVPDARTRVNVSVDHSDYRYRTDYGIPAIGDRPADLPWSNQYNDSPTLSSARTTTFKLDGSHRIDDTWEVRAKWLSLRSDTSEMDIATWRTDMGMGPACPGTGNPLCRYYFYVRPDGHSQTDQFNADLIGKFKTGGLSHTVLFGLDSYRTQRTGTTYFEQISAVDIYNPNLGNTPPLNLAAAMPQEYDDHSRWNSVYVQDQVDLGNGVHLLGGLRHDRTNAVFGSPGTVPNPQSATSPRLGVVWQFTPQQSVFAQYQDALSANNGRDTVTGVALAAERGRQFEVGHKSEWLDRRLSSTVSAYQLTKRNRGSQVLDAASPTGYNTITIGEAAARGFEWDITGQVTNRLSIIASYAYTDTEVTRDPTYLGKKLANVARHTASAWARYAIDDQWTIGSGIFAQSARQGDTGNTFQLPGYARVDAMASYRFRAGGQKALLQFNLDNVFNRKYYSGSHQFLSDWIKLGSPRTAKVTLKVDF
jgi:iron complex outermembrane receptor protein